MATARADPLRSTLDTLELDPRSESDRPYLVAMLRRLGYTERDIEETLRTGKMPTTQPTATDLAPARDYNLVVPARDSRFALDNTGAAGVDAPFEDLERVEFEDPSEDVAFEEVAPLGEEPSTEPTWEEAPDELAADETGRPLGAGDDAAAGADDEAGEGGKGKAGEGGAGGEEPAEDALLDTSPIDTFGDPDSAVARSKTRVRVRRVRAASKEEAERKVAGGGRTVIKSVPVDIVERWGATKGKKSGSAAEGAGAAGATEDQGGKGG